MMRAYRVALAFLALAAIASTASAADVIVPSGSEWKWLHPTDGKDPKLTISEFHTSFMKADFDDSSWKTGKDSSGDNGGFGYGEESFQGVDIGKPASANRKTAYFRHKFKTEKGFKELVLKLQRDDGIIVYLDGQEVGRENVGGGDEAYDLYAEKSVGGEEKKPIELMLDGELEPGEHVLAISLHNRAGGSSDLRIADITLQGTAK
jgi:hypothetical protein